MTDNIDVRSEDLVAMRVVEMKVGIDDRAHRLGGNVLQFIEQHPFRRRRHVIVDDDDVVVVDDDGGVPDHGQRACADGVVHALFDFVEPERLPGMKGAGRRLLKTRHRKDRETAQESQHQSGHGSSLIRCILASGTPGGTV